ncbi:NUDIX domain-containing protein [Novosphingobium resinovorum]|uniref:NUDIX domain-containing protein n=1 Tax=Novosphingobium resinovorum TaxID=158500 RepID=UPI003AF366D5
MLPPESESAGCRPKGNLMPGLPPHEAAAREAYEEAGVVGVVSEAAIGRYHARKIDDRGRSRRLEITLYSLAFERQAETWPEKGERQVQWFSPSEAAAIVIEPALAKLIVEWSETIRRSPTSPA